MDGDEGPDRLHFTRILEAATQGSGSAVDELMHAVYGELRRMADHWMAGERGDHTLSATALVHEAYLRLIDQRDTQWESRAHFLALASQAAHRVLVDHARGRRRIKRGGDRRRVSLSVARPGTQGPDLDMLALHDALERLAEAEPSEARIVEMRFFGGMTEEEIASVIGVSAPTVRRRWRFAKTWLRRAMNAGDSRPS